MIGTWFDASLTKLAVLICAAIFGRAALALGTVDILFCYIAITHFTKPAIQLRKITLNCLLFGFTNTPCTLMCVKHSIISTFPPSPVKIKIHRQITWVGFEPTTFVILQQMSYH